VRVYLSSDSLVDVEVSHARVWNVAYLIGTRM